MFEFECIWCHETATVEDWYKAMSAHVKVCKKNPRKHPTLLEAAEWALRGLEKLATDEAKRKNTTFEMCDYTFAKGLREAIKKEKGG